MNKTKEYFGQNSNNKRKKHNKKNEGNFLKMHFWLGLE